MGHRPYALVHQPGGRSFVVDATGGAEMSSSASAFLRALVAARDDLALEPPGAALSSSDPNPNPNPNPDLDQDQGPPPRRSTRFPRMMRLYDALMGRRERPRASPTAGIPPGPRPAPAPPAPASSSVSSSRRLEVDARLDAPLAFEAFRGVASLPAEAETGESAETGASGTPSSEPPSVLRRRGAGAPRRAGLDFDRVARELAHLSARWGDEAEEEAAAAEAEGEGASPTGARASGAASREQLRHRVSFLADALLAVLREVDERVRRNQARGGRGAFEALGDAAGGPASKEDVAALSEFGFVPEEEFARGGDDATDGASRGNGSRCFCGPQCYVCLGEFERGEAVRELPCGHRFHSACVDEWLLGQSRRCPTCRAEVPRVEREEAAPEAEGEAAATPRPFGTRPAFPLMLPAPAEA